MSISTAFITRPIATTLLTMGLLIFGSAAFFLLPVAALPEVEFPTIQISANLPGASPETMANSVASPLERQLATIQGVSQITSTSSTGSTQVTVQFVLNRSIDAAAQDVSAAINAARGRLPADLPDPPQYKKVNPADTPVLLYGLTSEYLPDYEVSKYADILAQQLSTQPGVSQVTIGGEQKFAVRVDVNPTALAARGIGIDEVASAITATNLNRPKGQLQGATKAFQLDANDQLTDAKQFADVLITYRNGAPVKVSDVARVYDGVENDKVRGYFNGRPGILLLITRQTGANVVETVDAIKARMPSLIATVPPTIEFGLIADRSLSVRSAIHEVEITLLITIALVIVTILLFLRNITATIIPATAVPLSLVGTFAVMYVCGFSLNNLTLMGLAIAVGLVVDDAIVMLENIVRYVEHGEKPYDAALKGASEIGFTIVSITVSLIAVFIPLLFLGGIVGRLFREFGVTVTASLLVSMVVSLTLTPMLASRFIKPEKPEAERGRLFKISEHAFNSTLDFYRRTLGWVLRHQFLTLMTTLAIMALTVTLYIVLPKGFIPQEDTGTIFAQTEAAPDVSFKEMSALMQRVSQITMTDPDIDGGGAFVGSAGGSSNTGRMFVSLKNRNLRTRSADQIIADLRPKFAQIQGLKVYLQSVQSIRIGGRPSRTQYQYTLQSIDGDSLRQWAPKIEAELRKVKGVEDVASDLQATSPRYRIEIDRVQAARLGISTDLVDAALYSAYGDRFVSTIFTDLDQYRVVMGVQDQFQADETALSQLYVRSRTSDLVPLSSFVRIKPTTAALSVNHSAQFPSVTLSFNLSPGVALGQVVPTIQDIPGKIGAPQTISARFEGTAQEFQNSLKSQPILIGVAIIAVYIVLGVLYESFVHPITILSTIPSAGLGALLGLAITGKELSVVAIIGIIMLIGIVKKNAIMMVDFAIEAERGGKKPEDAIFEACMLRFRPIMMTSFAAILGGVPLALSRGYGAELRVPLGVAIVGGLLVSQILTLYTTPVVYLYLDRFQSWAARKIAKRKHRHGDLQPAE
ncbi:efflux RND transporter permease subunit [Roseiterribacter gracilis]|uniref:Acriflavine resistance protein B n=1 Tax=Roseiterribacter gracilis TaxID=2812848 RepID=A0A8S8XHW0_9PROT|nr:acriflavine resistance protein B [Rhodospirillales bacterium TMPK1]